MSSFRRTSISLLAALLFFHLLGSFTVESVAYLGKGCRKNGTFAPASEYAANVRIVVSVLSTRNATSNRFHNATAGRGSDRVYGLFFCRADLSADQCHDCVAYAANDTFKQCPQKKEAVLWYDECTFRYAPRNIFSKPEYQPPYALWNPGGISTDQIRRFHDLVVTTMNETRKMASVSPERYGTKAANFTMKLQNVLSHETLYFSAQCTDDLTKNDCNSCLEVAIEWMPICCRGKLGARVHLPSCNVRFELYKFFQDNTTEASPGSSPRSPRSPSPVGSPGSRTRGSGELSKATILAIAIPISVLAVVLFIGCCYLAAGRQRKKYNTAPKDDKKNSIRTIESLQYDFSTIKAATNDFSHNNKLGQGGFGVVFKGKLPTGQEIAVKRLSQSSRQGIEEFKNEVLVVANLQHRNLVRLLGFCVEREEKILIYEYVPNKSLDYFLFNKKKQEPIDWSTRYKIIGGIVRGILYLHQDSRLTIIHRDLKASNILLDSDMNPKISDFGMAKIFGVDQTQGSTSRVVGTYGYMSPEYAMYGHFSTKSDIYSLGVLLLEIISGGKNNYECNDTRDLLNYAWRLWKKGSHLELSSPELGENFQQNELIRCIHIGLLCVQEEPADRPTITTIVSMLDNYSITLPEPQQPGFYLRNSKSPNDPNSNPSISHAIPSSVAQISITDPQPR